MNFFLRFLIGFSVGLLFALTLLVGALCLLFL